MMKKVIKTETVLMVWNIINTASYKKLDDADKIKLWKIARLLKPIATQFNDDSKDAAEKLKPENFDAQVEKARDYEAKKKDGADDLPMTDAEYTSFIREVWVPTNQLVAKATREFADKEVEVDFDPLSEEAFGKLMASNDWTIEKVDVVGNLIVE